MSDVTDHTRDCDWHLDQYDHECTCGWRARKQKKETAMYDEQAKDLALMAQAILRADGDRDGDNGSNLTVAQTVAIAKKMREIASAIIR